MPSSTYYSHKAECHGDSFRDKTDFGASFLKCDYSSVQVNFNMETLLINDSSMYSLSPLSYAIFKGFYKLKQ